MLKLRYWSSDENRRLIGNVPNAGKDRGQKEKRASEDEMAGWHHRCNEHELGQTRGDSEGQGGLVCCGPWGHKELDTTGRLNNNNPALNFLQSSCNKHKMEEFNIIGRNYHLKWPRRPKLCTQNRGGKAMGSSWWQCWSSSPWTPLPVDKGQVLLLKQSESLCLFLLVWMHEKLCCSAVMILREWPPRPQQLLGVY